MKLKCAILDDYQNVAMKMADWSVVADKVEVTVFHQHMDKEDDVVRAIQDFDIVVIMRERTPFRATIFERLDKLKLLITSGMRNASIDLAAASAKGVVVCGTASYSEPPTELAWSLILGLARGLVQENHSIRNNGPWQQTIGKDLYGSTLGLLGLGKIGGRMARIAQAFGMKVIAWSQNLTLEQAEAAGVQLASSKEELLMSSDFVSIHLVLSERTRGLIGPAELQLMRPTSYLINTSRAQIVDQAALVEALQKGKIAGAGIDVFETEPLPENDILRKLPNVLATPHLGYVTLRNYQTYYREAVEDIVTFLKGSPIRKLS
ncbi:D-2-hydroxyacid dehydrogenase family protein [Effusibacillus lacus]|uniref:Hydroxyacid dehydrogenase n=1 Tax=Effusibacillus lacus TaxID=1348429 RepID=A0A292YKP9_9BACL|nr:D-2-hydroxyacid dehydrogenase family protein [Effusibacillus lacus]TCS76459.1 phosphoglycerate dehydrogenase-like enzyme [Effusibacillus lacus]GAX90518.1 hydroxyacid dehydrogenase [Effusibacillus lacus]